MTDTLGTIVIERRFRGPPNSANGGYACGRIASYLPECAEVTLWSPPPLDHKMVVLNGSEDDVIVQDGARKIASASRATIPGIAIKPPSFADAQAATARTFAAERHQLPGCFVCGPHRKYGDGLRIHVGPLHENDSQWNGVLAAPWVPSDNLADEEGVVLAEFVWAALDCPTAYACSDPNGLHSILLGRQTVDIARLPRVGEECVVATQQSAQDGRKYFADAKLFSSNGDTLAVCAAVWIQVDPEVQQGLV